MFSRQCLETLSLVLAGKGGDLATLPKEEMNLSVSVQCDLLWKPWMGFQGTCVVLHGSLSERVASPNF